MAEQDYKFIEEKIEPKKKRLFVEAAKKWFKLLLAALVFGVVASATAIVIFNLFGGKLKTKNNTPNPELVKMVTRPPVDNTQQDEEVKSSRNSFQWNWC